MMLSDFPLWPDQASTIAPHTDALYIMLVVVTGTVSVLIFTAIFALAIIYRRRPDNELAQEEEANEDLREALSRDQGLVEEARRHAKELIAQGRPAAASLLSAWVVADFKKP